MSVTLNEEDVNTLEGTLAAKLNQWRVLTDQLMIEQAWRVRGCERSARLLRDARTAVEEAMRTFESLLGIVRVKRSHRRENTRVRVQRCRERRLSKRRRGDVSRSVAFEESSDSDEQTITMDSPGPTTIHAVD